MALLLIPLEPHSNRDKMKEINSIYSETLPVTSILMLFFLMLLLPIAITIISTRFTTGKFLFDNGFVWIVSILVVAFLGFVVLFWNNSIDIRPHRVTAKSGFYKFEISNNGCREIQITTIPLEAWEQEKPSLRKNGVSLPGFNSGYFSNTRGEENFYLLVGKHNTILKIKCGTNSIITNINISKNSN